VFDIGFLEMLVIGVVALLVLGPERLPKAARMVGAFFRKARSSFDNLKREVEREIDADRIKNEVGQGLHDIPNPGRILEQEVIAPLREASAAIEQGMTAKVAEANRLLSEPATEPAAVALSPPELSSTGNQLDTKP
jgi:sec-independent protein translocase protein TatB